MDKNKEKNINISLCIENIGPHRNLNFKGAMDSNRAIFYATNGTGKTFISRSFRLCTPSKAESKAESYADKILAIGKDDGHFSFSIRENNADKRLDISIKRGLPPHITDTTGYIYHVFNSDYVEENIKLKNYSPDGDIEGYILGKVQIDLTEEKNQAVALEEKIKAKSKEIDDNIAEAKLFLTQNGIMPNTTEYKEITRENVEHGFEYEVYDSVEDCIRKIKTLEKIPEDLKDIQFSEPNLNLYFLDQLETILMKDYQRSEWDEEFVREYKDHQNFIEAGLDCDHSDKICPFCKREYTPDVSKLIEKYNEYRTDKESQVIGQLRNLLQSVNQMAVQLNKEIEKIDLSEAQLTKIQNYFPSLASSKLEHITKADNYRSIFQSLYEMTTKKTDNLTLRITNAKKTIGKCRQAWSEIEAIHKNNQTVVIAANKTKNDTQSERLALRKNLCKAKSIELQNDLRESFKDINENAAELKTLQDDITEKENQIRISKRDKVYETFESYLNMFFNGKYHFDKDSFQIEFLGKIVGENASNILSDGEKSIVAFCWYLAETHTLVKNEDDYNKLFFIIDDPVSSMDYNFVYAVTQAIREIGEAFGISPSPNIHIWIFTHNYEFFNMILANSIFKRAYMIKSGSIQKINHNLLVPYESHLLDLIGIAEGTKTPDHTTGNSIRHVIETIARFEDPRTSFSEYFKKNKKDFENSDIYSLSNDLSHGYLRSESPYSEDTLRNAAKTVIEFLGKRYPMQLEYAREMANLPKE